MSPGTYIAGTPAVGRESRNVYRWCAHGRIRVQECILLVRSLYNARPGMYIAGVPTVECESIAGTLAIESESRDVYYWCAHCTIQVEGCITLVRPLYDASPGMYIVRAPTIKCESQDVYRWCAHYRT